MLSFTIGLGSVLCFSYRLKHQIQEKLLSSLKPGIRPVTGILKYALAAGNTTTSVCVRIIPKCCLGYAKGHREMKITHREGADTWNLRECHYPGRVTHPLLSSHLHTTQT